MQPSAGTPVSKTASGWAPEWLKLLALALSVRLVFLFIALNNGCDAWVRLHITQSWLKNHQQVPSEVWPPLHFWLLGGALWIWSSELSARLLTLLFGSLTVLPFWGIMRRLFDSRVALWSTLLFALFGFHIAYSVTTSSEAPSIFFLVLGLYGWVRFYVGDGLIWLLPSGLSLIAGSLCRYEVWVFILLLSLLLLDFSRGAESVWLNHRAWKRAASFGLLASLGMTGWMLYSWWTFGGPLAAVRKNAWVARHVQTHQSLAHRLGAVPGAIVVTLSPVIAGLAIWGILRIWRRGQERGLIRAVSVVAVFMAGLQVLNSITSDLTEARFTLMYSWLLIPYAFEGLRAVSGRWELGESTRAFAALFCFFLTWQAAIIAGAYWTGHPEIADRLSVVSPTLPLPVEQRALTAWLKKHASAGDSVVVDQFNYEAADTIRFSGLSFSRSLGIPYLGTRSEVEAKVKNFLAQNHPRLLVYCPTGQLGKFWPVGDQAGDIDWPEFGIRLHRLWAGGVYRVYQIDQVKRN